MIAETDEGMNQWAALSLKWLCLVLTVFAFFGGCQVTSRLTEESVERRWSQPVEDGDRDEIPVLVHESDRPQILKIIHWGDLTNEVLVTDLESIDETEINRQIAESLSINPGGYKWFEVLEAGEQWADVRVEYPTLRDQRHRSWYRIQDGTIIPQRRFYISALGILVYLLPYPALAGGVCALAVGLISRWLLIARPGRKSSGV